MSEAQDELDAALREFEDASRDVRNCEPDDMPTATKRLDRTVCIVISAFVAARQEEIGCAPAPRAPQATIFLRDSSTPKRVRYARWYHKGGCLNVELTGVRDDDGLPMIMEVPHEQYTYALRPHLPYAGMGERKDGGE